MFTDEELWQMRVEIICDHLIDRDDYFALSGEEVTAFLDWARDNYGNFYDIDGLAIDQMFDKWITSVWQRKAA